MFVVFLEVPFVHLFGFYESFFCLLRTLESFCVFLEYLFEYLFILCQSFLCFLRTLLSILFELCEFKGGEIERDGCENDEVEATA